MLPACGLFRSFCVWLREDFPVLQKYFRLAGIRLSNAGRYVLPGHLASAAAARIAAAIDHARFHDFKLAPAPHVLANPPVSLSRYEHEGLADFSSLKGKFARPTIA
jgi:hypothetical protein